MFKCPGDVAVIVVLFGTLLVFGVGVFVLVTLPFYWASDGNAEYRLVKVYEGVVDDVADDGDAVDEAVAQLIVDERRQLRGSVSDGPKDGVWRWAWWWPFSRSDGVERPAEPPEGVYGDGIAEYTLLEQGRVPSPSTTAASGEGLSSEAYTHVSAARSDDGAEIGLAMRSLGGNCVMVRGNLYGGYTTARVGHSRGHCTGEAALGIRARHLPNAEE